MSAVRKKTFTIPKILALALILAVSAVLSLPFIVDVNRFKPEVETMLTSALGRAVTIGNLKLALLSGSIAADNIAIADDPSFGKSPFVRTQSLRISVEWAPLIFSQTLRVTGITLEKPEIALIRSDSGEWNFSRIGAKRAARSAPAADEKSAGLPARDVMVKLLRIVDGRLTVSRREGGAKPYVYDKVNLQVRDLSFASIFPFTLTANLPGGGTVKLDGKAGPINTADASLTPFTAALNVARFNLVASGFVDHGSGIAGLVDFNGNVVSDGAQLQSQGKAKAEKFQFAKGGSPADRPFAMNYKLNHNLRNLTGTLSDSRIEFGKAGAQLAGSYDVHGKSTVLKLKLHGENMPLEELQAYLPPAGVTLPEGASLQGGTLAMDLASEGPVENLVTTGTVGASNTRLVGFDLGGKLALVARLAGIKAGSITEIEKFTLDARVAQEGIQANSLLLIAPALGRLNGTGIIRTDHSLDFKMVANLITSGGIFGSLASLSGSGSDKELTVPFSIRGTTLRPTFVPDVKGVMGGILGTIVPGKKTKEGETNAAPSFGDTLRDLLKKKEDQKAP
jgi:AsmA protein